MLFTGDHVMQGSTVVIGPPDGNMQAYLRSLESLLREDVAVFAPGHGYLIGEPHTEVRRLIAHRLAREAKVAAALERLGASTLDALVPRFTTTSTRACTASRRARSTRTWKSWSPRGG